MLYTFKMLYCVQDTFIGRVKHFLNITDPRTLFVSKVSEPCACLWLSKHPLS